MIWLVSVCVMLAVVALAWAATLQSRKLMWSRVGDESVVAFSRLSLELDERRFRVWAISAAGCWTVAAVHQWNAWPINSLLPQLAALALVTMVAALVLSDMRILSRRAAAAAMFLAHLGFAAWTALGAGKDAVFVLLNYHNGERNCASVAVAGI